MPISTQFLSNHDFHKFYDHKSGQEAIRADWPPLSKYEPFVKFSWIKEGNYTYTHLEPCKSTEMHKYLPEWHFFPYLNMSSIMCDQIEC